MKLVKAAAVIPKKAQRYITNAIHYAPTLANAKGIAISPQNVCKRAMPQSEIAVKIYKIMHMLTE